MGAKTRGCYFQIPSANYSAYYSLLVSLLLSYKRMERFTIKMKNKTEIKLLSLTIQQLQVSLFRSILDVRIIDIACIPLKKNFLNPRTQAKVSPFLAANYKRHIFSFSNPRQTVTIIF